MLLFRFLRTPPRFLAFIDHCLIIEAIFTNHRRGNRFSSVHVGQYLLHQELVGGVGAAGVVGATGTVGGMGAAEATGGVGAMGATGAYLLATARKDDRNTEELWEQRELWEAQELYI